MLDLIFDVVFGFFSAWNQIGLLLMAGVFLLIGGGILGYEIYWRIKSVKIKGHIKALKVSSRKRIGERSLKARIKERESTSETDKEDKAGKAPGIIALGFFLLIPSIFVCFGLYMAYSYIHLTQIGEKVSGVVVRNEHSYDSEGGESYNAIVRFNDRYGREWELRDNISYGSSPSFETGTKLQVYYDPEDPENFAIDNLWHNITLPLIFAAFGMVFILIFVVGLRASGESVVEEDPKPDKKDKKPSYVGEMYHSVFEYKKPNGEIAEFTSDVGSGTFLRRLPGTQVTLLMSPDNPDKVKRPSILLLFFGLVFFLPGLFILHMAITTFEANFATFIILIAAVVFISYKIWNKIKHIPFETVKEEWKKFKLDDGAKITSKGRVPGDANILSDGEIQKRIASHAKYVVTSGYVMMLIAIGLSGGAYYVGLDMVDRMSNGFRTVGEVVNINTRRSSSSEGGTTYTHYSVVKFKDHNGKSTRFEDSVGSSHPMHKRGDQVDVLFMPNKPKDAIVDRGLLNWGLSGALALGALLLLFIGYSNIAVARRHRGTKYRKRV